MLRRLRRRNTPLHFSRETPVISTAGRNLICPLVIGNKVRNLFNYELRITAETFVIDYVKGCAVRNF